MLNDDLEETLMRCVRNCLLADGPERGINVGGIAWGKLNDLSRIIARRVYFASEHAIKPKDGATIIPRANS